MSYEIYDKTTNELVTTVFAQKHELKALSKEFCDCYFCHNSKQVKL